LTSFSHWSFPCFQRAMKTDEVRGCPLETFGFSTPVTGFYRRFVSFILEFPGFLLLN